MLLRFLLKAKQVVQVQGFSGSEFPNLIGMRIKKLQDPVLKMGERVDVLKFCSLKSIDLTSRGASVECCAMETFAKSVYFWICLFEIDK